MARHDSFPETGNIKLKNWLKNPTQEEEIGFKTRWGKGRNRTSQILNHPHSQTNITKHVFKLRKSHFNSRHTFIGLYTRRSIKSVKKKKGGGRKRKSAFTCKLPKSWWITWLTGLPRENKCTDIEVHRHCWWVRNNRRSHATCPSHVYANVPSKETSQNGPPLILQLSHSLMGHLFNFFFFFNFKITLGLKTPHIITGPSPPTILILTEIKMQILQLSLDDNAPFSSTSGEIFVKSKASYYLYLKTKCQPSKRWQRHHCHQETNRKCTNMTFLLHRCILCMESLFT